MGTVSRFSRTKRCDHSTLMGTVSLSSRFVNRALRSKRVGRENRDKRDTVPSSALSIRPLPRTRGWRIETKETPSPSGAGGAAVGSRLGAGEPAAVGFAPDDLALAEQRALEAGEAVDVVSAA